MEDLERVEVKQVAPAPDGTGAAILLGNAKKTFVIYIGAFEATAIVNELRGYKSPRPLTHDLLHHVFLGFDIVVRRVVISSLVDNTFCATLYLEQKPEEGDATWSGRRHEVRIDARASDSMIIALKERCDIWVARAVFDAVEDITAQLPGEGPSLDETDDEDDDPIV